MVVLLDTNQLLLPLRLRLARNTSDRLPIIIILGQGELCRSF